MENPIVLQLDPSEGNPRNSEGAFADLPDGRLMFAYTRYCGTEGRDASPAEIAGRFNTDQGRTWSPDDTILLPNEGKANVMSVSLLSMGNGDLGLFYMRKDGPMACRSYLRRSRDGGQHWSDPVRVVQAPGYFVMNNDRVIRLGTGRIVVPVAFHRLNREPQNPLDFSAIDHRGIAVYYLSDDDGQTWRQSADWYGLPLSSGSGLQEPGVVELKDGRVWSWCRTDQGQQWSLWSSDGGDHWTPPVPTRIMSPCSPASVKRIPSTGDLLMVWNDHERSRNNKDLPHPLPPLDPQPASAGRTPLVAAISQDEGRTWSRRRCLETSPAHGFCYTAIHFVEDHVLLAYCAGGQDVGNVLRRLRMRQVPLAWLYQ